MAASSGPSLFYTGAGRTPVPPGPLNMTSECAADIKLCTYERTNLQACGDTARLLPALLYLHLQREVFNQSTLTVTAHWGIIRIIKAITLLPKTKDTFSQAAAHVTKVDARER